MQPSVDLLLEHRVFIKNKNVNRQQETTPAVFFILACKYLLWASLVVKEFACNGKSPGQNTGVGCHFPSPGDLSDSGIEPMSPVSSALAGGFFTTMPPGTDSMGWGMVLKCGIKHIILVTFNFCDLKIFCATCYADWHYFNFVCVCGCAGSLLWHMRFSLVAAGSLCCPMGCGILVPQLGVKPMSPALEDRFLTTGPPGKSPRLTAILVLFANISSLATS